MNTIEEAAHRLAQLRSAGVDTPSEPPTGPATPPLEVGTEEHEVAAPGPEGMSVLQAQWAGECPAPSERSYAALTPPSDAAAKQSPQAAAQRQPRIQRMSSERWRMASSLLLSLLIHGWLLSLTFGGKGLGLPGLRFPWQERRIEVPELRVVLVPTYVTAAQPASTSVAQPLPQASIEPPIAGERASTPHASPAPPRRAAALAIVPAAKPKAEVKPEGNAMARAPPAKAPLAEVKPKRSAVARAAPAKAPTRAGERGHAAPAKIPKPAAIDVAPSGRRNLVVPPAPTGPDVIAVAPSVSSPESVMPVHRDAADLAREQIDQDIRERAAELAKQADRLKAARIEAAKLEAARQEEAARVEAKRLDAERQEAERLVAARLEAERQEVSRQEVAARIDAARRIAAQEEERLLAARQEAARVEAARAAQLEAQRQEAARQEEAARIEATRRIAAQEEERLLAARQEAARVEAARAAQLEAQRQEAARQELARVEAARLEAARQEASRLAAARLEAERQEASRLAATQLEAERQETARQARVEAARLEAERQEAARQAAGRQEVARVEAEKEEDARREARRRAIGRQLDEEAAQREAPPNAARQTSTLPLSLSTARRARLWGRADPNVELVRYAEGWARKIQFNTPVETVREVAKQPHTHPMVTVAIRSDGSVESVTFVVSSGVRQVDEAIRRIVQSHEHYQAFPPALAHAYDVIEIRRTWHFHDAVQLY